MRSPPRAELPRHERADCHQTRQSTQPAADPNAIHVTIVHLRRALTASSTSDAPGVKAGLFRATRTIDETRHPDIAAAIRIARGVDPVSRTVRQYIRKLLRRLVSVVNCWEPPK